MKTSPFSAEIDPNHRGSEPVRRTSREPKRFAETGTEAEQMHQTRIEGAGVDAPWSASRMPHGTKNKGEKRAKKTVVLDHTPSLFDGVVHDVHGFV